MTRARAQLALLAIFVISLALLIAGIVIVRDEMWPEEFNALIRKVLAIYSVQLSVILGGIFARRHEDGTGDRGGAGWAAIALSILWNALLAWRGIAFATTRGDSVVDLMGYLENVSSASAFLVTGALAFFFTQPSRR